MAALVSIPQPSLEAAGSRLGGAAPEAGYLQEVERLTVHSGNLASWSKLRRRAGLTSTDELVLGAEAALKSHLDPDHGMGALPELSIRNVALTQKVGREERKELVFSLKVFLSSWDGSLIGTAVYTFLEELGMDSVESVVVAFPPSLSDHQSMDDIKMVWKHMELLVEKGLTRVVGVADLMRPQLAELYHWASVKPMTDQLNLAHCCMIPEDLTVFAKQYSVTLHTHNDDRDILPSPQLQALMGGVCGSHGDQWGYTWVAKYSSVVRMRGIIAHKGYLTELQKISS